MRKKNTEAKYYVYVWYVTQPFEVFYVGKGSNKRASDLRGRNKFFMDMYNTHDCDYCIVVDHLREDIAFEIEAIVIAHIRQNYTQYRLTNVCDGGEGASGWVTDEAYRNHMRAINTGAGNPNYHNWWSDEQKQALSQKIKQSGCRKGAKNCNAKPVMCVETGVVYDYIADALKAYAIPHHSNVSVALHDPQRTAGGVHWVAGHMIEELCTQEARQAYLQLHKKRNGHS